MNEREECIFVPRINKFEKICRLSYIDETHYTYNNITRTCCLLNFFTDQINEHISVDLAFELYLRSFEKKKIKCAFLENFENFVCSYMQSKFHIFQPLLAKESGDLIVNFFPAFMWVANETIFLVYDTVRIEQLISKYLAMSYVSSNVLDQENNFINIDKNDNSQILQQKELLITQSICPNQFDRNNIRYEQSSECNSNYEELYKRSIDTNLSLKPAYVKHSKIKDFWVDQNEEPLCMLFIITEIVEITIKTMMESLIKEKIELPKIKVNFSKNHLKQSNLRY